MSTASATASRPSIELEVHPRALERRLLVSYLLVFGVAFLLAALFIRALFVAKLQQQSLIRLQTLARAGLRTAVFNGDRLALDPHDMANARQLMLRQQGLQWFDLQGKLLGSQGLTPVSDVAPEDGYRQITSDKQIFDTFAIPIVNQSTLHIVGTVRASEPGSLQANIRSFDLGLLISALLAIVFAGIAGRVLTRRAVQPVSQAFETLGAFVADASHELRSPLAAISSNADAALRDVTQRTSRDTSRFEAISDAAKQMSRLTNDLLLLAVANASLEGDLYVVDLTALIDRVIQRFQPRFASAAINLNKAVERGMVVYGNPDHIDRILSNLLENALRYTPRSGSVWVEGIKDRSRLLVIVRDTGIGIAPDQLSHVFERFWRADPSRSTNGAGLGLAIARALARRHGGDVAVTSHPGSGSEFTIVLPVRPNVPES